MLDTDGRDGHVRGERRARRCRPRCTRICGRALGPVHHGRPGGIENDRNGKTVLHRPGSIFLDGKNVLGLVVEIDCALQLGGVELFGVVAETLTRGRLNVRLERAGRPEVHNLMLAPKQFDATNRDLEIRDLYNMEDAFDLKPDYQGAYPARLNANLAFWDRLDGEAHWPADDKRAHPLTELLLADYLVVDATKPYAEQGSFFEIKNGLCYVVRFIGTCGGRALNDNVMDNIFTLLVNAGNGPAGPRWRRPGDASCHRRRSLPGSSELSTQPEPPKQRQ